MMPKDIAVKVKRIAGRGDLIVLFVVALLIRLLYLFVMIGEIGDDRLMQLAPDTIRYVNIGQEIIGHGPGDEDALVIFGPGYGYFLGLLFLLFGQSPYPILILQIILSSTGCLLIYALGRELTDSKTVGLIAGYLAALSFTSVSMANYILSDCLFFFLFLLGTVLFLRAMRHEGHLLPVAAGLSIGAAILVRSIGQFWPAMMVLLVFILPRHTRGRSWFADRLAILKRVYLAPLIALVIMGGWITRNYAHHSVPFLAFTSAGGPASLALAAIRRMENREQGEIRDGWMNEYKHAHGLDTLTLTDMYRAYTVATRETFHRYPWPMLDEYRKLVWENIGAMNELYYSQLPSQQSWITAAMSRIRDFSLHYAVFWLCIASGLVMIWRRQWPALFLLGGMFLYFALLMGFTRWQGSRLFYPAQIAWTVAVAFLIIEAGSFVARHLHRALWGIHRMKNARPGNHRPGDTS